jgi:hypothetical protein
MIGIKKIFYLLLFVLTCTPGFGQNVPLGIFYQAVARDNFGKELANKKIDIRFTVLSGNKLGQVEYEELHSGVITSPYGVFSRIIGSGEPLGGASGSFSQISWSTALHFLKVEVKFESSFIDMGTMQFLAVPYALYAQKSLEPGPTGARGEIGPQGLQGVQGLKGDQGDPATDDQTLSFDGNNISISGGNTLNLSNLMVPHQLTVLGDTLSIMGGNKVGLPNQIQDLQLDLNNKLKITKNTTATEIDFTRFLDDKQQLTFNSVDNTLVISGGNAVSLESLKNDADADPLNEIQTLTFNPADNRLSISGVTPTVDLTSLKNDADYDPLNEIQNLTLAANILKITNNASATNINLAPYMDNTDNQTISYNAGTNTISLTNGGSASLGSMVAFRARKTSTETVSTWMSDYDFLAGTIDYNDGGAYDNITGIFTAPSNGIYTFNVGYTATGSADSRVLKIFLNGSIYEILNSGISPGSSISRQITLKLVSTDKVKVIINVGTGFETGTGSFSGFRVY